MSLAPLPPRRSCQLLLLAGAGAGAVAPAHLLISRTVPRPPACNNEVGVNRSTAAPSACYRQSTRDATAVTTHEQGCKRSKQSVSDLNMLPQLPLIALTFAALLVSSTYWGVVANELDLDDVDSTTTVRFAC
jgi:hypothetical protein